MQNPVQRVVRNFRLARLRVLELRIREITEYIDGLDYDIWPDYVEEAEQEHNLLRSRREAVLNKLKESN